MYYKILTTTYTKYQSTNFDADLKAFKLSRSIYRCKLITYKSSYVTGKISNFGISSKEAFKLSFKLIGRDLNRHLPDQPDSFLCTTFSSFFQRNISLIIDSLPRFDPALFDVTHITSTNHWSCFTLPSHTVVFSLLNSLKSHSPLDPVPLCLFHSISLYLIGFITYIINLSLITAVVPQLMKYS